MKGFLLFLFLFSIQLLSAQTKHYRVCIVAFYNLENLYDTINNPMINDDDFTPAGTKKYNSGIYFDKLSHLSTVLSMIGTNITPSGPAIIGVAEIENDTVLFDLIHQPLLRQRHYNIIHYNSQDPRGIDVALLYNPDLFLPEKAGNIFVPLPGNSKSAFFTRDILYVKGLLAGEPIHVLVNHWPSRRGGEERSAPARETAAAICKQTIDSILLNDPAAKIILMGDLNDNPDSPSITQILQAKANRKETGPNHLFNPWTDLYNKGIGTLANRDSWGLFDQILLSHAWLNPDQDGLFYYNRFIFNKDFMRETHGPYKNYPMRTWDGNTYRGGYSDHFPSYIVLLKSIRQ